MTHQMNPNPASSANEVRHNISAPVVPAEAKALQEWLGRFVDHPDTTLPPYRPVMRRALCYDLAMRTAAARAAAVQPRLTAVASNVTAWREVPL